MYRNRLPFNTSMLSDGPVVSVPSESILVKAYSPSPPASPTWTPRPPSPEQHGMRLMQIGDGPARPEPKPPPRTSPAAVGASEWRSRGRSRSRSRMERMDSLMCRPKTSQDPRSQVLLHFGASRPGTVGSSAASTPHSPFSPSSSSFCTSPASLLPPMEDSLLNATAVCWVCRDGPEVGKLVRGCDECGTRGHAHLPCLARMMKMVEQKEETLEKQTKQIGKVVRHAIRSKGSMAMKNIEVVFKAIDADGSGDLDHEEFTKAMNRLALGLSKSQIKQCIHVLDKDGDGEVSLAEFMTLLQPQPAQKPKVKAGGQWDCPACEKLWRGQLARHELAKSMRAEVLQGHRTVLGSTHPQTLQAMGNLGMLKVDLGEYDEASKLLGQAVEGMRKVHGDDHPATRALAEALAHNASRVAVIQQADRTGSPAASVLSDAAESAEVLAEVVGVRSQPQLNGATVRLLRFDPAKSKYVVASTANGADQQEIRCLINPANL